MSSKKWSSKSFEKERSRFFKRQQGCCAICKKHQSNFKRRLCLDHRHSDGLLRGLLCAYCNHYLVGRLTLENSKKVYKYLLKAEQNER